MHTLICDCDGKGIKRRVLKLPPTRTLSPGGRYTVPGFCLGGSGPRCGCVFLECPEEDALTTDYFLLRRQPERNGLTLPTKRNGHSATLIDSQLCRACVANSGTTPLSWAFDHPEGSAGSMAAWRSRKLHRIL